MDDTIDIPPCTCGEPWCDNCAYQREQAVAANPCPTCKGSGLKPKESTNPNETITRARALCDELSKVYTRAPDETASKWRDRFASAQEGWIVRADELVRELADALEAKGRELVDTRERKSFDRRELEKLKARACDAVGMPGTTDSHSVGDRIEMLIKALERERDNARELCERLLKERGDAR